MMMKNWFTASVVCALALGASARVEPNVLKFADGRDVKTSADWTARRAEVAADEGQGPTGTDQSVGIKHEAHQDDAEGII